MRKFCKQLLALVLIVAMWIIETPYVCSAESVGAHIGLTPTSNRTGAGKASIEVFQVQIKSIPASGESDLETYNNAIFGNYDYSNFTPGCVERSIFITAAISSDILRNNVVYCYDHINNVDIKERFLRRSDVIKTEYETAVLNPAMPGISSLNDDLVKLAGALWPEAGGVNQLSHIINTPELRDAAFRAGRRIYYLISIAQLDDYFNALAAGNEVGVTEDIRYIYGAMLVSMYVASCNYTTNPSGDRYMFNEAPINEYLQNLNLDGSSSYVFIEVNSLNMFNDSSESPTTHYAMSHMTGLGVAYGVHPSVFANVQAPYVEGKVLSNKVSSSDPYVNYYQTAWASIANDTPLTLSNGNWAGDYSILIGMLISNGRLKVGGTPNNRTFDTVQVCMDESMGELYRKPCGQPGTTWLSTCFLGASSSVKGHSGINSPAKIMLEVKPKQEVYSGEGSVKSSLYLSFEIPDNHDRGLVLASWQPGMKLVVEIEAEAVAGEYTSTPGQTSPVDDVSVPDSLNVNKVTIPFETKEDLEKWLNGDETLGGNDRGIIPDFTSNDQLRIMYSATGTYETESGTVIYKCVSRGKDEDTIGTYTAKDWSSWISPDRLEYHSSDGADVAYAEVKSNSPNNEKFEAMAGIPTTQKTNAENGSLIDAYVTAGGQTWQVDMVGEVAHNEQTTRTIKINVTINNCWGENQRCEAVCTGHDLTHNYPVGFIMPNGEKSDGTEQCDGLNGIITFAGDAVYSNTCRCGTVFNFTHSPIEHNKEGYTLYGERCSGYTNHDHPTSETYSFSITTDIDDFNFFNIKDFDSYYLDKMEFKGAPSLFTNPNATVTNDATYLNIFNQDKYASGNGRLCFEYLNGLSSVYGINLSKWGDITIDVSSVAGTCTVNGSGEGAKHNDSNMDGAVDVANEVLAKLASQQYKVTIISDYAEIGVWDYTRNAVDWQALAYYQQESKPTNLVQTGAKFSVSQTTLQGEPVHWKEVNGSTLVNADDVWHNNVYRTLRNPTDIIHTGYNGQYASVKTDGSMSGKFNLTGTYNTASFYKQWHSDAGRQQPNAVQKVYNGSTLKPVTLTATNLDIIDTHVNGEFKTGECKLYYTQAIEYKAPGSAGAGNGGFTRAKTSGYICKYRNGMETVNNIVIHNPVSVEFSEVLCNPEYLDQRTDSSKILIDNIDGGDRTIYLNQTGNTIQDGIAFINIAKNFTVTLSDLGNFADKPNMVGIANCTAERGLGYVDNMDCSEWTIHRYIRLPVHVTYMSASGEYETAASHRILDAKEIAPMCIQKKTDGTEVTIMSEFENTVPVDERVGNPIPTSMYNFVVLSNNDEKVQAGTVFLSTSENAPIEGYYDESMGVKNQDRYGNKAARHTATKNQSIDVIGFIGNLTINDTGDFRFAELFKNPIPDGGWLIPNVVRKVDYSSPNMIASDPVDILFNNANEDTDYHATFGNTSPTFQGGKSNVFVSLPLTPADNINPALQTQEMRPGYNLYMDIETIGNYYGENFDENGNPIHSSMFQRMVIKPRYWSLNLDTGVYTPVDVYYSVDGKYQCIVPFDSDDTTFLSEWLYYLDWGNESARRNYVTAEKNSTQNVISKFTDLLRSPIFTEPDPVHPEDSSVPTGDYITYKIEAPTYAKRRIGTANTLFLDSLTRTFIGSSKIYGETQIHGDYETPASKTGTVFEEQFFQRQSQRWNFTLGLPSSSVFVERGRPCTTNNINVLLSNRTVIVCALDIKVQGQVWALEYEGTAINYSDPNPANPNKPGFKVYPDDPEPYTPPKDGDDPNDPDAPPIDDPIVVVYNPEYTSEDDLRTEGTH